MCVFPFILNISLLFFKRLKLRIFYPSFDRALLFPSSSLRCFFWHKIIFCNFHCFFFGIKALHYFLLAVTISTFFLFSIRIITQNTRARSLIDLHCFVECMCVCVYVSESVKQWLKSLRMCLCVCICLLGLSFPLEVKKRLHRILLNPTSFTTFFSLW